MITKDFYVAFGNMLYALAMSDGAVQPKEKETIIKLVRERLVPLEDWSDQVGTDLAHYTVFAFETADDQIMDGTEALENFLVYVKEHKPKLEQAQFEVLKSIMVDVAKSYGRITKKEQAVLDIFEQILK